MTLIELQVVELDHLVAFFLVESVEESVDIDESAVLVIVLPAIGLDDQSVLGDVEVTLEGLYQDYFSSEGGVHEQVLLQDHP